MTPALQNVLRHIATLGYVGFVPKAPGTLGTLFALGFVALIRPSPLIYLVLTGVVVVVGTASAGVVEEVMGRKDPSCVVVDEFAGYMVAVAFLPRTAGYLAAAFILFRIFDILKPPPIRWLQYLKGGMGVMADDLAAALLTNAILQLWRVLIER